MSTTMTTTSSSLGTSHLRGSSSKTRSQPMRVSRNARPSQRQLAVTTHHAPEIHGFYPAITHFTDAITALPRDFRRHTSLLKEVDAKSWAVEENIQKLLVECLTERQEAVPVAHTVAGSTSSVIGDVEALVNGEQAETASVISNYDQEVMRRRKLYAELRSNLMQVLMPLDEKNHVINNANDELSRHTRRQDEIWPYIEQEISEETRLGSLKHWALTDLNPVKKVTVTRGREAIIPDNEVAERSERRREAMALAKKQKTIAQTNANPNVSANADSDADLKKTRKPAPSKKAIEAEEVAVSLIGQIQGVKVNKPRAAPKKDEKKVVGGSMGGVSMSRENSQQTQAGDATKKRKAPTAPITVARKRINASAGESPKLVNSPLAGTFTFDKQVKKSPALAHVKPVNGRGRTSSLQSEASARQPSASRRNGVTVAGAEMERVMSATGKTAREVRQTMKETTNTKGEKVLEEDVPETVENRIRGGIALERSASKSSQLRKDDATVGRRTASPRLIEKPEKKRSKTNTPVMGTFDPTESESAADAESEAMRRRAVRPRIKDHHGLHDSLSPKGLPTKRAHKHKGSYSLSGSFSRSNTKEDEPERKPSRTNSRKKEEPKSTEELVDEPESIDDSAPVRPSVSRRTSQIPRKDTPESKPPTSKTAVATTALNRVMSPVPARDHKEKEKTETPLGSPGPDVVEGMDMEVEEEDDDPNETRYCYCGGVSYGEMVACDNDECAKEWFHLECTGLRALPPARSTWYCDDCKRIMAR